MLKQIHTEITGGIGADVLIGTERADYIQGKGGGDWLDGRGGNDLISGGLGDDRLFGGGGSDRLYGGIGDDRLYGGDGHDILHGGRGNGLLTGGEGHDRFVFDLKGGNDLVTDYTVGEDRLDFRDFDIATRGEVLDHALQNGADVVFTFDGGETVTLQDVQLTTLHATDILI